MSSSSIPNSSKRTRLRPSWMIAAACAAVAIAPAGAKAGLVVELRALPGPGYTVSNGGQHADVSALNTTVTIGVFAKMSGTNTVQVIDDFNADADPSDTRNDEALALVAGSFSSMGPLLGDLNPSSGAVSYNTRTVPFTGPGSTNGVARDFDSDGDLDIGEPGTSNTNLWIARANEPV